MAKREIKFRGLRLDTKEWVYGYLYEAEGRAWIIPPGAKEQIVSAAQDKCMVGIIFVEVDPATVGQFTGLHSKSGKAIWEGDIVNVRLFPDSLTARNRKDKGFNAVVEWLDHVWGWGFQRGERSYCPAAGTPRLGENCVVEVIGDKFQNPDLLEPTE